MNGHSTLPTPSEPDSGSNASGSEDQDSYPGMSEPGATAVFPASNTYISRQRYHPRRTSSSVHSSASIDAEGHPNLPHPSHGPYTFSDMSSDTRRQSLMAMDRKRRLTSSTQESIRRRQGPGTFYAQEDEDDRRRFTGTTTSGSRSIDHQHRRSSSQLATSTQIIDLTSPTSVRNNNPLPPTPPVHPAADVNEGVYVVPRWQPDSEASDCPICKRPFSFLFRRHHCRKCGRVVCNECSPHRITIPRQYIVNPPGYQSRVGMSSTDAIDLTSDGDEEENYDDGDEVDDTDEDNAYSTNSVRWHRRQRLNSSFVGGGEKVRLCNPCVPDPQPEHRPTYNAHTLPFPASFARRSEPTFQHLPRSSQFPGTRQRDLVEPFPGIQPPHFMPPFAHQSRPRSYRNSASTFEAFGLPASSLVPVTSSSYQAESNRERSNSSRENRYIAHGRYHSLDQNRTGFHSGIRPRVRSMLEDSNELLQYSANHSFPRRSVQLNEDDICPICRRALPPKGSDGDETEREAHIMGCITSRDPTMQASHNRSPGLMASPPRGPMHMLTFVSTEKDCIGDDGGTLECSICMVEYDVGEQLARLECLCKFHRECIVSWFERKQECPVHKIA